MHSIIFLVRRVSLFGASAILWENNKW